MTEARTPILKRKIPLAPPLVGALLVAVGGYFAIGGAAVLAGVLTFFVLAIVGLVRAD